MNKHVTIPYAPRKWALKFHDSTKRWIVLVLHRRAGKTVAAINHLLRDACRVPNSRYAYISPTYKQSKDIAWDMLKKYARPIPGVLFNESELRADLPNGSRIRLYGADNPDSLRGIALWGVVFDEYSQQPSNIFTEIIRPALADHQGYAIWIGTPKGKNDFFRLYQKGLTDDNWLSLLLTVEDTGVIAQSELDDAKSIMSEDEYRQEWLCSFEAAIKGAYYAQPLEKMKQEGRIGIVPYDKSLKVYTFWDLGMSDSTAIGFFQYAGRERHMIDYYENSGEGLQHYISVLQSKGYVYGDHFAPHDIQVRELGTGRSRLETAASLGLKFRVVRGLPLQDGIDATRMALSTLWIDEQRCQLFLDYISQYRKEWDDKNGCFKDKPLHDFTSHAADMLRYFAIGTRDSFGAPSLDRMPIKRNKVKGNNYNLRMA